MSDEPLKRREIAAPDAPPAPAGYAQALEVTGATRTLWISGQVPLDAARKAPEGFDAQARQVWSNVEAQLRAAGYTLDHLVKVTTWLADRSLAGEYRAIRAEVLGDRRPTMTTLVSEMFDPGWLLEVEAVAQA